MRPYGSPEQLEARRILAIQLLEEGKKVSEVCEELGVTEKSVYHWKRILKTEGLAGLQAQPHPHRPSQLSAQQRNELAQLILQGPEAHGWKDQLWTLQRIAELIEKRFGITYHVSWVWKLLHSMGLSCQKPERVAMEQDPKAVEEWRTQDWPRIKRQAARGKKDGSFSRRERLYAPERPQENVGP